MWGGGRWRAGTSGVPEVPGPSPLHLMEGTLARTEECSEVCQEQVEVLCLFSSAQCACMCV